MSTVAIVFLVIAATYFVISLVHTVLIALVDCSNMDEDKAIIFMGGPVLWIIRLIRLAVAKIKKPKKKNK